MTYQQADSNILSALQADRTSSLMAAYHFAQATLNTALGEENHKKAASSSINPNDKSHGIKPLAKEDGQDDPNYAAMFAFYLHVMASMTILYSNSIELASGQTSLIDDSIMANANILNSNACQYANVPSFDPHNASGQSVQDFMVSAEYQNAQNHNTAANGICSKIQTQMQLMTTSTQNISNSTQMDSSVMQQVVQQFADSIQQVAAAINKTNKS